MKEHILVVDDEEIVRTGLAENLASHDYVVSTAASGEEALDLVERGGIDLMLCDLVMEPMDGMKVLRQMQMDHPDIPVIVLTGYGTMDSAVEALRLGASDYIQKPAGPEEVMHRIESVLDTIRMRRNMQEERRKAEARRRELYSRLVRAERMVSLGVLADGMAYELNNILAPVVSYPGMILSDLPADSPIRGYIEEIEAAGSSAVSAIHDLQTIGRGGSSLKEPIDLNDVVQVYLESAGCLRLQKLFPDVEIQTSLDESLADMAGSRGQVTRMLENLTLNAMEAMPRGGTLKISTTVKHVQQPTGLFASGDEGDYAVLTMEDNGVGMKRVELERVFEPFYTSKTGERRQMGGLGLTVVYRIVKDHRGFIDVESTPGKGTKFTLYFPLGTSIETPEEKSPRRYEGTERILVVDDYEEQRKVASTILRSLGYEVLTADSGRAAVSVVEELGDEDGKVVDLVVLDMVLADDFDGLETYKRLIELNPEQRAIIVSGFAETDRIVEVRKLGAGSYVQKPYSLEALGKAVRDELDRE
jgi:CheY-like chemotaxis protein